MTEHKSALPGVLMKLAVAGSALLAIAAGGLFYYASTTREKTGDETLIPIEVGSKACDPMQLTLPSGYHSFAIHNRSDRPVEWEILDGVMVVEERENIIPGMKAVLRAHLLPGDYEITCGLLSNPRGRLSVTPSDHSQAVAQAKPDIRTYIGLLSEYKVFLTLQSNAMIKGAQALQVAINTGDLAGARQAYMQTRAAYNRTEVTSGRFADLAARINPLAAYLEHREADPAFTGFHRIEYGLWQENNTQGLEPVARQLSQDLTELQKRVRTVKLTPDMLVRNTVNFLNQQAENAVVSENNTYSALDLADFKSRLDGVTKIISLLQPLGEKPAATDTEKVMSDLAALQSDLAALSADALQSHDAEITPSVRKKLADATKQLAGSINQLTTVIGLE